MKNSHFNRFLALISIIVFIAFWGLLVYFIGPEEIIQKIGAENGYILIFVIALLGGVSTFTSPSYFAALITFAIGGLNPLFLAVFGGLGMAFGDALFFYLGTQGRKAVSGTKKKGSKLERLSKWIERRPKWALPILIFAYSGFAPLPNDILAVLLAFTNYSFKRFFIAILLGNINLSFWIAFFASRGVDLFS